MEKALSKEGIKVDTVSGRLFRLVTHYWISDADVQKTVQSFDHLLSK
jgi:hypothetical protein